VPIRVIMLHIECQGKLSLLEVYRCENEWVDWLLNQIFFNILGSVNKQD
jgi:hypothetical protein